jgi:hypothetical protein
VKNFRKHIDDFFREKLGHYAETPPSDVWEDLDKRLDTLAPSMPQNVPGSPYRWLWHFGMVSVMLVVGVSLTKKIPGSLYPDSKQSIVKEETISKTENTAKPAIANTDEMKSAAVADVAQTNNDPSLNTVAEPKNITANDNNSTPNANQSSNKQKPAPINKKHTNALQYLASGAQPVKTAGNVSTTETTEKIAPAVENTQVYASSTQNAVEPAKNEIKSAVNAAKKEAVMPAKTDAPVIVKRKPNFPRFELGIKAGYERGFNDLAATKYTVSPYVQFNITPKLSVMTQPAIKYSTIATRNIGGTQTYYEENNDGTVTKTWEYFNRTLPDGIHPVDKYYAIYTYTQTHDSIVKSHTVGGSYMEFELPLLLKYKVTEQLSVYGGANMIYAQLPGIEENTGGKDKIMKTVVTDTLVQIGSAPTPSPIRDKITYTGTPYSNYTGPLTPATSGGQLTFGYTVGFSYEYSKRWLFDALMQQNPAKTDVKGGYNVNIPLSSPYFRITVGYKIK